MQVLLTVLHIAVLAWLPKGHEVRVIFDLIEEGNLPVWWSTLLFAAIALGCLGMVALQRDWSRDWHWVVLSAGFAVLSIEETAQIHEIVGEHVPGTNGGLPELWVLVYAPFLLVGALAIWRAGRDMEARARRLLVPALACYVGVLVAELLAPSARLAGRATSTRALTIIEENLELLGSGLLLLAVLATLFARVAVVPRVSGGPDTS